MYMYVLQYYNGYVAQYSISNIPVLGVSSSTIADASGGHSRLSETSDTEIPSAGQFNDNDNNESGHGAMVDAERSRSSR